MKDYKEFSNLLDEFSRLPQLEITPPTFMEIAGFPHYENVCSNILAYYLDSSQPHKLRTLLLKSLLQAIGLDELAKSINSVSSIQREETTTNNKRIDIVICADNVVIGIENKVYASLYNDLNEYSTHLHQKFAGVKHILKIVLSLNAIRKDYLTSGFVNITYANLFEKIKINLGEFYLSANTKDITYLMDFILTIQNLTKMTDIDPALLKFFINNKEMIDELLAANNDIKTLILQKVNQVRNVIDDLPENVRQWIWDKRDLVHDFTFSGVVVAVDCLIAVEGITIQIWVRSGSVNSKEFLNKLAYFKQNNIDSYPYDNNRFIVCSPENVGFDTPSDDIGFRLNQILKEIYLVE